MGSEKRKGREQGPKRRPVDRSRRRGGPGVESLEGRLMMAGDLYGAPKWVPTSTNVLDAKNGPLAELGPEVVKIYSEYQQFLANKAVNPAANQNFVSSYNSRIFLKGGTVSLTLTYTGDRDTFISKATDAGLTLTAASKYTRTIDGYAQIDRLPDLVKIAELGGGAPNYKPITFSTGSATNQSELTLKADVAKTQFGLTGAGVGVGVISDSVNRAPNPNGRPAGLAGSVASGDLPNNVTIIQDEQLGGNNSDEGRAMLEQIYDIAPGSPLYFATGFTSTDAEFGANILALSAAGAKVIVDDVGIADEPVFQDSEIQRAINTFVAGGGIYLSSAGNSADSGYQSNFRGVNATVNGVGAGRYMNFDPGSGTATTLPISVYQQSRFITLQFDNPYYTTNGVTSSVEIYILDSSGNVVSSGTANNIAQQRPIQLANGVAPGSYQIAVKVASGPDPGRISITGFGGGFIATHRYGSNGGTTYANIIGHNGGGTTISVGATPFWGSDPYLPSRTPVTSEPFSSFGPLQTLFDTNGNRLSTPTIRLAPDLSAPQGNATSFFGFTLDTTNPPNQANPAFPGEAATTFDEPATSTNVAQANTPHFFGTSSAAPNLAAVIALMKQLSPTSTRTDIINALTSTATPLNGSSKGTWNPQGGYGQANALSALNSIDNLRVSTATPGAAATVTSNPGSITLTFSKPVNFATVQAGDLIITGPNGVTVKVGTPVAVDNPTTPTQIRFPYALTVPAGVSGNGTYRFSLAAGVINATDGKSLLAYNDSFVLNDSIAPRVASTSLIGRTLKVTFTEPMNPLTITSSSIFVVRTNNASRTFNNSANQILNGYQGFKFSFDAATNTATLDFSDVNQALLPTDRYALVVNPTVADSVGNTLDGEFTGTYPSGNGSNKGADETFRIDYGVRTLTAPTISSLVLTNASDSGIKGDQNTNVNRPSFSGQVTANFPGTVKGVVILAQFSGLTHAGLPAGGLDLTKGDGGRGFKGTFDVQTTTDEFGRFTINFPAGVTLPDGYNKIRVVAIGQPDSPPLPGLSSQTDQSFRVDTTRPFITGTSIASNANINGLSNLSINFNDPISPSALNSPFAVPVQFAVSALDPASVANLSNYDLIDLGADGVLGTSDDVNRSSYIKSAAFTSTSNRTLTSDPYRGRIDLTFNPGVPGGKYIFVVHTKSGSLPGIVDSAGNGMGSSSANSDFTIPLTIQPVPTYITSYTAVSPNIRTSNPNDAVFTGIRSYYEVPGNDGDIRAEAAPTQFVLDFSNTLADGDYTSFIQLVRTKGTGANAQYTGTFGNLGITNTSGFTVVPGTKVDLVNSIANAQPGQPGYKNRLVVSIAPGTTLEPDNYRLYVPNTGSTVIRDIFGNQLDGEFLGNTNTSGSGYETLLPNGKTRGGLSGDGVSGGAFITGFTVVPHGNIIYARPDYFDDPFSSADDPDGSFDKPYPVLAPQATANALNGGDLNSAVNFGTGFDSRYDRSGKGRFDRSAFYAASQLSKNGPVVIVALAAPAQVNPVDGSVSQSSFVLQAPSGSDPLVNDGSASVPFGTTLSMGAGSILKMRNASLFVQNQGSALQLNGTPTAPVTITSYLDDSIGGDTNRDGADSTARGGDFGGVVFRNYTQQNRTTTFAVDGRLQGPTPTGSTTPSDAITGADDVMSVVNFATVRFGGGAVPQTIGTRYDALMMFNSRPTISNATIADTGTGGLQASISVDVDSLREDDIARGPLIRRITNVRNSLNGIFVRAELNGVAEPTDAVVRPNNPTTRGGAKNYVMDDPIAYLFASRITIGASLVQETGGSQVATTDRLYISPGMILKFQRGAALEISNANASLNVGDRTYISRFDQDNTYGPTLANGQKNPDYVYNTIGDARAIFTSLYDDAATTSYFDPLTQTSTTIVPANPGVGTGSGSLQPSPGQTVPTLARWGSVTVQSGALAVIDEAELRYGGGSVNTSTGTQSQRDVLAFVNANGGLGTRALVTNNNFFDNLQAPISVEPNGLLAGDPSRPLVSGHPFFRGNLLQNNEINGLEVLAQGFSRTGSPFVVNQTVNALWDATDITYVLRDTIVLAGSTQNVFNPPVNGLTAIPNAAVTLSLQSALPDTILADGTQIARPGESLVVKLLNLTPGAPLGSGTAGMPNNNINSKAQGGAGFLVGIDNGVDPTADGLIDPGAFSQIRITGIGANETTGQARVPVVITSLRDNTVGTTVRGVAMNTGASTSLLTGMGYGTTTTPSAGDGGVIGVGSLSYSDYNLYDPRDGSIIDNADIRYITRIEQQGGGILALFDTNGDGSFDPVADGLTAQKSGIPTGNNTGTQFNVSKGFTISNSKLDSFSQAGLIAHPGVGNVIGVPQNYPGTVSRVGGLGLATQTFIYNTSMSNMPIGVRINSETADNASFPTPPQAVLLNNTFFNVAEGVHTEAPVFNGVNSLSHVAMLAMNNIFANSSDVAIRTVGQSYSAQGQYNLFFNNNQDIDVVPGANNVFVNFQPVTGDPKFRNPAKLDFSLLPGSAAIDAARSELGPSIFGNMLSPASTQQLDATVGIRNTSGRANQRGGLGIATTLDYVALPGFALRNFRDQFVPVLASATGAIPSAISANQGTYYYAPISGERDGAGFLRIDTAGTANVGFGSRPFFDIGAFEYRDLFPPHVTGVTATISGTSAAQSVNIYSIGSIAGTNQAPQNLQVTFDARIDPATINSSSVVLDASGGDGVFGNGNSPNDRTINLGGRLSFDAATKTLTINTANLFPAGSLNDVYRLRILGDGANVLRDPNGNALDGENLDASGNQRALPSGDSFPGGNFQVTFSISTNKPSIVSGSFKLDPNTDSNLKDGITNDSTPTFIGKITDTFPPLNFLQNQTVIIDISSKGDGNFDILNAGTGTTDVNGNFSVTITNPIPDSPYNVGPSGVLAPGKGNTGYATARVRVINQSGNPSNLPSDPISAYVAAGAATGFVVDTTRPKVTSINPPANASTGLTNGQVAITVGFDKNIDLNSLNANTIIVTRAGGDGIFGNANDVTLTLDTASITPTLLFTPKGALSVTFGVTGNLANDLYRVVLKGTGTAVTDVAGNPLNGGSGGDYSSQFAVFSQSLSKIIYVGANSGTSPTGSRTNPYPTITAGLAAATTGDTVAVLEGVYTENITLKGQVRLVSAAASSTATNVVPGNAQKTLIYGPNTSKVVVTAGDISLIQGLETEISGFSIVSAFAGDSVRGTIRSDSVGLSIGNSNILVDRNYFLNNGFGVAVQTSGSAAPTPRIVNNGFVGNLTGVLVNDTSRTTGVLQPTTIANNTIALNTDGIRVIALTQAPLLANIDNNIFWQNHELNTGRKGSAIFASTTDKALLRSNLFSGNSVNNTSPADDTYNIGNGFNPAALAATPDANGNFAGDPKFVAARDPRPNGDTPAVFFLDGNFDLTATSAAIDNARAASAPTTDFRYRTRVDIAGKGFSGRGPADVGAFEFNGTGGIAAGAAFRVATTSLAGDGSTLASGRTLNSTVLSTAGSIIVDFSGSVNKSTVSPTDLILSGSGLNAVSPAKATSLSWIDDHTVRFNLSGGFNSTGTVKIEIPANAVLSASGAGTLAYSDSVNLTPPPATTTPTTTTVVTNVGSTVSSKATTPAAAPTASPTKVKAVKKVVNKKTATPKPVTKTTAKPANKLGKVVINKAKAKG